MFDVFYQGPKPNLFPYEQPADTLEQAALQSRTGYFWFVNGANNYQGFDFEYKSVPWEQDFIHVWPSQWQRDSGTYLAHKDSVDQKQWHFKSNIVTRINTPNIFFIDKHNSSAKQRYDKLLKQYPNLQRIRYVGTMLDTVKRCANKSTTENFWIITSENVYDEFDFTWHPDRYQTTMSHVFGSQWQKWSETFYLHRDEFLQQTSWVSNLEQLPNLNFVDDQKVQIPDDLYDIYFVDHGNDSDQLTQLKSKYSNIKTTRYVSNYLDTFKRIMSTATTEYVWIVSSLCDYQRFDFSWQPEPWQREMVHVFPSANQKRGDTFYIHVESFKQQMVELELLDWFNVINYCEDQRVTRLPIPVHTYTSDNLTEEIKQHEFKHPYTWFIPRERGAVYTPGVWSEKDKQIVSFSASNSYVLVPREAKNYINTQVYDYPYISKLKALSDPLMDVIFISNGEPMAEANWNNLVSICPRAKHSKGVTGREAAYKAAAQLSDTPWFFAVFAKTEVLSTFKFDFQPDYLQAPKHYIFHSRNPLNGLEYGAMNINLYNKQLVLDTKPGIDFTLSALHAVVPICASISRFNTDPWITWRSAFREVLKLRQEVEQGADVEIQHRLTVWMTRAEGDNAEYCLRGAQDADAYYTSVNGAADKLQLSFDWAWLQDYYYSLYNSKPWLESV